MRGILVFTCCIIFSFQMVSQDYKNIGEGKIRLLGFNMTEMVTQFMPFSQRLSQTGPFQFRFMGGGEGHLFNMQLGAGVLKSGTSDIFGSFNNQETFVNMVFGYARLKQVSDKFYHYFSQNMMFSSGFLNQPEEEFIFFQDSYVAFNAGWGVGYMLSPRVSISTEIQLVVALNSLGDDNLVQFIPPVGLFLVTHIR